MRTIMPIHHKTHLEQRPVIYQFQGDDRYLSNFWPCQVMLPAELNLPAMTFKYVENGYMAWKTLDQHAREAIQDMTPGEAKKFSYSEEFVHRPDFSDEGRIQTIKMLVDQKFSKQNVDLLQKLVETKDALIIEGNLHCDTFFGFNLDEGYGQNHLGRIIMSVREERLAL